MRRPEPLVNVLIALGISASAARAGDAGLEHFETKVRPVLVAHCYECHSAQAKKLGGNLLLDSRDGLRKGGDSGETIVPGKPNESLLIAAVRYSPDAVHMPPKGKLPAGVIADFETWIKMGAPDPRDEAPPPAAGESWDDTMRARRDWWSIRPVVKPPIPDVRDAAWPAGPVDRFILAALEERGLPPAPPAEARTLARRLSLVLIGLPPTAEQMAEFLRDWEESSATTGSTRPAIERLADRLLASPHYGERFARHWMDVVRFSETHGNEWNYEVHHAWRYRDYLIRALNDDVPYDQLVREHIAGDLLPHPRINGNEQFNESVIGTAFYRFGEANHDDCISLPQIGYDLADNQIDTLTKAFQATTVACARCHNHKLDAISTEDYYALLGVLRSSRQVSHTIDLPEVNASPIARLREIKAAMRHELAEAWARDAGDMARYMQAAQTKRLNRPVDPDAASLDVARLEKWLAVLAVEKAPREDPFEPWRLVVNASTSQDSAPAGSGAAAASTLPPTPKSWSELAAWYAKEDAERTANQSQFATYADFRAGASDRGNADQWQIGGQGLREPASKSGDFAVATEGDAIVRAVLPAGLFTHALSDKLNGTLRSPVLTGQRKNLSFQVAGQRSSALRLVSNNCQLNYKNYKALTSPDLAWITFSPPENCDQLRTYAELMTMFDNPKFPDQLSALGGDKENYKLPWEKAAENPRSYFGITRVVMHDGAEPPKPELSHMRALFAHADGKDADVTVDEVPARYAAVINAAIADWAEGRATDDDARWLDALVRAGLLTNSVAGNELLAALVANYRRVEASLTLPRIVPGVADCGPGFLQPVLIRGDCTRPGEPVARRYLEVLSPTTETFAASGSGRLELAERIASPTNPLTARVLVNRLWHHLFGAGIVRTVDDFGHVGELPSHPELLDYLAATFVEEGWSMKRLVREIVLSRTFGAVDLPPQAAAELDPQNRLLAHYPARRMQAEAIRDCILATSGRLDRALFGMSIQPYREKENADRRLFPGPLDGHGRRSVYIKNNLMEAPKFLSAFDFPGGKVALGRRDVTNVPAQALALLNDPFVLAQANEWAGRLIARQDSSVAARIDAAFETALGRLAREDERQRFVALVAQLAVLHQVSDSDVLHSQPLWRDVAHTIFNLQEFVYIP
ncbi:MAG TPA: PSD1 and planctomycete cytochrome C domain-containing protein [Pirellulales bacterium]|nr:PSD1 and planctomycete cytochrome C domain-containing protein [Pirellulales bacterium]